jgi:hypothetical protein
MAQTCTKCSRVNPPDASYCYYDGSLLEGHAQNGGAVRGNQNFPSQFVFPSGLVCRNFDQLAQACQDNWASAVELLKEGYLERFLGGLGRADLAFAAREASRFPDRDRGLDQLLAKLPSQVLESPKLHVEPREVNLGLLNVGDNRQLELHLSNNGSRLLYGNVTVDDCKWLTLGEAPGTSQKVFQFGADLVIPLQIRGANLRAGNKPLEGKLLVESNGGNTTVLLRCEVPVRPFTGGVLAGAKSPRQIAEKAKAAPKEAAALFERGAVADWYKSNGWTYPVQGPSAAGLGAVQQFFEALGLTAPPKVDINEKFIAFQGNVGNALRHTLEVKSQEKRPVFAHGFSDQPWLVVERAQLNGRTAVIGVSIPSVPDRPGEVLQAKVTITSNGNQRFVVPVTLTIGGQYRPYQQPIILDQPMAVQPMAAAPIIQDIQVVPSPVIPEPILQPVFPSPVAPGRPPGPLPMAPMPVMAEEPARAQGRSLLSRLVGLLMAVPAGLVGAARKLRNRLQSGTQLSPPALVHRHTDVSFPARVRQGKVYRLRVQVVPATETLPTGEVRELPKPHPHDVTVALAVPQPTGPLRVIVSLAAENFEIEGPCRAELLVPLASKSAAVSFGLRGQEVGPGRIMVDFTQDGRPVGSVDLFPQVLAADQEPGAETAPGTGEVRLGPGPASPPPDLILKVFEHRLAGQPGRLQFILSSTDPRLQDLPVLDGDLGTQDLRSEVAAWVDDQLRLLAGVASRTDATSEEVHRVLCDVGHRLYHQLLPEKLQGLCWTLRQRGIRDVLILSDEPHIPWELIKPYRADPVSGCFEKEDGFWAESFALTHWLRGRPPVNRFGWKRVLALAAGGAKSLPDQAPARRDLVAVSQECLPAPESGPPSAHAALPAAEEEIALIRTLQAPGVTFTHLTASRRQLQAVFEEGGFNLLHLACHGTFGGACGADRSAVLLEDGLFTAAELSPRMEAALRRTAPLIFFNACHSGRLGFSLTGLGSWSARLVELGCGGFIGTLWPVTDRAALTFAQAFYDFLTGGLPIGAAVWQARRLVRERHPSDPTWLAYCCFADPLARLQPVLDREG